MNDYQEMQGILDSCKATLDCTRNTMDLYSPSASDSEEILRECADNLGHAKAELAQVESFLNPQKNLH